jgi:uncharacterized membrane protein
MESLNRERNQSKHDAGKTHRLVGTAVITAAVTAVQMAGLPQPLTGPLVNAGLFLAGHWFGAWSGIMVGLLTPFMAWLRGQLPHPLFPMIPFIALGNAALVLGYIWIRDRITGKWKKPSAILLASGFKCMVLTISAQWLCPLLFGPLLPTLVWIWTLPQFATALAGGLLFTVIDRALAFRS